MTGVAVQARPDDADAGAQRTNRAGLVKRSMSLQGHRTSVALEAEFWEALEAIAIRRQSSISKLVRQIDQGRGNRPLASALRLYALRAAQSL